MVALEQLLESFEERFIDVEDKQEPLATKGTWVPLRGMRSGEEAPRVIRGDPHRLLDAFASSAAVSAGASSGPR
jgi:hypothetical protein